MKQLSLTNQIMFFGNKMLVSRQYARIFMITILCNIAVLSGAIAQTITGTVNDDGGPLIGVTVMEKGTSNGVVTDIDGKYSIKIASDNAVLVFSYIGYATQELPVAGKSTVDVVLGESASDLEEVVVVGYTTRKKGELTGSVASIGGEELEKTANKDLVKSLSGRVPGLVVSDRGGYPGETGNVTLLIRGKSTLNNNSPLILVDGVPSESFAHLAPQDIESISVLKDGAAAIYGARAANGVILVTTRRGKTGAPKINFSSMYTASTFSALPKLMTSEQFAIYRNEAAARHGLPQPFTQEQIDKYAAGNDPNFPSTDWSELTFADYSPEWRSSLSISGGTDKVKYFVSGDYLDLTGMYSSGDLTFNQYQLRSNVDVNLHKTVKLGVDVFGRFGDRNAPAVPEGFIYKHIYVNEPTEVAIYDNGLYAWGGENGANPLVMSSNESGNINRTDNNLRSKITLDLDLGWITEGLTAQGYAGIRNWTTDTKSWYTPWTVYTLQAGTGEYIPQDGFSQQGTDRILTETYWKYNELMLNGTLRYKKTFGSHNVGALAGYEQFSSETRTFEAERRGFPSDNHPELFAGSDEGQISTGGSQEFGRLNYFGSVNYNFDKKYFVDLTLRHDGSSNFGEGQRFGTFPGVAVAWSITDESFMDATSGWLNSLKLRASWALMGNDRVGAFQYLTRYNYGGDLLTNSPNYYTFGTPGVRYLGYRPANVPNPDITWETADMRNIGLSFALLDFRLTGDINYFYQSREDILIRRNASIPVYTGLSLPSENLGKVDNFGVEVQLGWSDKIGENISYNIGANLTNARNKVVYLDEAEDVPDYQKREGFPMDSYMVFPTDGIFADQAQVDATVVKKTGTVPGEPIYLDTNDDGVIDALDRVRVYSSNVPEIQYGISGGLSYKNFDFNFLLQGQAKAKILVFFDQSGSLPEHVFTERWTPENPNSRYPRAFIQDDIYSGNQNNADNFQAADLWLHDASFLRLKEVEFGYRLSKDQIKFGNLRVFVRGFNVLTMFSEVAKLGLDPEAAGYNNFRASTYPSLKSYSFGVNLTF